MFSKQKQVGKVSVEWLAGEKTKVVGTFPPRSRWSGYVEKDTAGQTNIYSVEVSSYNSIIKYVFPLEKLLVIEVRAKYLAAELCCPCNALGMA